MFIGLKTDARKDGQAMIVTKVKLSIHTSRIPVKGAIALGKKIVKVWMMMMMKEGIFAGHPSLALPPSTLPCMPKRKPKRQNVS